MASTDPLQDKPAGYPKLATQMSLRPELSHFRNFSFLNSQNLLYLQAELTWLEAKLQDLQKEDCASSQGQKSQYTANWYWFSHSAEDGDTKQWDVVQKIRALLREYHTALIQQVTILKYPPPDPYDLAYVQNFLHADHLGALALTGNDAHTWGSVGSRNSYAPDLITLYPRTPEDHDLFSAWVVKTTSKALEILYRRGYGRHGVLSVDESTICKWTYWITSVVASFIPVISIVILYRIRSMPARLGTIMAFNILISVCMSVFAKARRIEVFAVTAAFAAVQVVFVASDNLA